MKENDIAKIVVDCAYQLHVQTGPGMLERVYQTCLAHLLRKQGLKVELEKSIPFVFDGVELDSAFRLDLLVEDKVIIEVKSVSAINETHIAQTITYLKFSKKKLGLVINFNAPLIKEGIRRVVNQL
jgi:GxxExxY protein